MICDNGNCPSAFPMRLVTIINGIKLYQCNECKYISTEEVE